MRISDHEPSMAEAAAAQLDKVEGWRIWRSVRTVDERQVPDTWYATLLDPKYGVDPMVTADNAAGLAEEIKAQQADVGKRLPAEPAATW